LLSNIALSVLDEHFDRQWRSWSQWQRERRRAQGLGTWRFVRYADLCRVRHKSAYAEGRIMPAMMSDALVRAVGGVLVSA
jgi:RNA-directed DNA polymerase